jgi:hypothetical protein
LAAAAAAASSLSRMERAVSVELQTEKTAPAATLKPTAIIVIVAQVPVTRSSQNPCMRDTIERGYAHTNTQQGGGNEIHSGSGSKQQRQGQDRGRESHLCRSYEIGYDDRGRAGDRVPACVEHCRVITADLEVVRPRTAVCTPHKTQKHKTHKTPPQS